MKKLEINVERITEPPEKVLKMYAAVMGFLHEERDMGSLKVSEITTRAGIGKGTAYEYFSSKEELLSYAMMWGILNKLHELAEAVSRKKNFREKVFCVFDWLEAYKEYANIMIQIIKGTFGEACYEEKEQIAEGFAQSVQGYIFGRIDEMLDQGYQEGIFTETDKERRALAFFGAVIQYAFVIMGPMASPFRQMGQMQLKEFSYNSMIKALN